MKIIYLFILFSFCMDVSKAQTPIKGKVQTIDGKPLSGVTVRLTVGKQAVLTKPDGSFSINLINSIDTLITSMIGYHTERIPYSMSTIKYLAITLIESTTDLKEVTVSTGYYQIPQERATGSFTQLNEKQINASVSTDILSRLKGIASGVSFDERTAERNISIRGLSTIYADAQPLIVLNNFPFDGDINDINPNDVESISILKDAAAASIWGVRAANGVLVITTKKGALNKPTEFNFNSNFTYGKEPDVYKIPIMSSSDYIGVEKYLFFNGFYTAAETDPTHPSLTPAVELMIAQRDGKISSGELNQQLATLGKLDVRNDFKKYLYQNSYNQQYSLSARGGSDKSTYYYSVGYDKNADYLNNKYNRLSIRLDNTINVSKSFKINPVISYTRSQNKVGRPDFNSIIPSSLGKSLYPYAQFADNNGNPVAIATDYRSSFISDVTSKGLLNWSWKPLEDFDDHISSTKSNDLLIGLNTELNLSKKLSIQAQYQYENIGEVLSDLYTKDSYYVRNYVNSFAQDDGSGNLTFPVPNGGILTTNNTYEEAHTGRLQAKYNTNWQKNELTILGGAEVKQFRTQGNEGSRGFRYPLFPVLLYRIYAKYL